MDSAASDLFEDISSCCDSDESRGASDSSSHDPREWSVDSSDNEFGATHSVLLRSDGTAVACGDNRLGQCNIPDLVEGVIYTHVDTGVAHTVLLASDGTAVACGSNEDGACNVPALSVGVIYTEVATGFCHTVLLKSDGTAVALGDSCCGQCDIPTLPSGVVYNKVAVGGLWPSS